MMLLKKNAYDKLVAKVNGIDTSGFVLKSKYDTDKSELDNKIPDTSSLVKKAAYDAKITDIEGKIPDVSNLVTKPELATAENKIPNVSILVKKADCNTKITELENKLNSHNHDKFITTPKFNTLAADAFNARLSQANLVAKTIFDNTVSSLNRKIAENKTKNKSIENELKKLKMLDLSYFIGKSHFDEEGAQNYLVFQPINNYFKLIGNTLSIQSWQSKGLSAETINPSTTSLSPLIDYVGHKIRLKFSRSCLRKPKLQYTHGKGVNIYIVYELGASTSHNNDPTLKNCLFGAVTLTKNADIEKYGYSGYGIGFDRRSSFSFPGGGFGQNILIFGVDMSSPSHIDNKKKDILVLRKGPTQGLENTLTAEKIYSVNFTVTRKKICLSLHYNGANSYLFVSGIEIDKFKAKDSEIVATPLCLGNISKDWSVDNMKITGLNGYVYDFSVDCDVISVDDIKDIHKYLMKKNDIV